MRSLSVFFLFLTASVHLWAQEELSLARAIEIGLQNNFDVQIQKLR
jgi:hypothetical protein